MNLKQLGIVASRCMAIYVGLQFLYQVAEVARLRSMSSYARSIPDPAAQSSQLWAIIISVVLLLVAVILWFLPSSFLGDLRDPQGSATLTERTLYKAVVRGAALWYGVGALILLTGLLFSQAFTPSAPTSLYIADSFIKGTFTRDIFSGLPV